MKSKFVAFALCAVLPVCWSADAEARKIAEAWEAAVLAGNRARMEAVLDSHGIVERGLDGLDADPRIAEEMRRGLVHSISETLFQQMDSGGHYRLVSLREEEKKQRAVFRLESQDGLNYHDVVIGSDTSGQTKIIEFYVAITGETLGQSLRRVAIPALAEENRSLLSKLMKRETIWLDAMPKLAEAQTLSGQRSFAEALAILDRLPQEIRETKPASLLTISALLHTDAERYLAELTTYEKRYPGDPSLALISIDGHFLRGDYPAAMATIDKLDASVSGDPYLDLMRGSVRIAEGKISEAESLLIKVTKVEPSRPDAYFLMADLALSAGEFGKLAALLDQLESNAGVDLSGVPSAPEFAPFMQSETGRAWALERGLIGPEP